MESLKESIEFNLKLRNSNREADSIPIYDRMGIYGAEMDVVATKYMVSLLNEKGYAVHANTTIYWDETGHVTSPVTDKEWTDCENKTAKFIQSLLTHVVSDASVYITGSYIPGKDHAELLFLNGKKFTLAIADGDEVMSKVDMTPNTIKSWAASRDIQGSDLYSIKKALEYQTIER